MAVIKCRYKRRICDHCYSEWYREDIEGMCYEREQLHAAECPYYLDRGTEKRTYNGVDFETLNEECTHAIFRQCEFEIKTNNYKLEIDENTCQDQGYLKVGKTVVSTCMIDYLEIDGRILISEEEASK